MGLRYDCVELTDGVCTEWVQRVNELALPEGAGLEIGFALLAVSALAWGVQMTARVILNR